MQVALRNNSKEVLMLLCNYLNCITICCWTALPAFIC